MAELELRIKVLEQLGLQREEDLKAAQQELQAQTAHAAVRMGDLGSSVGLTPVFCLLLHCSLGELLKAHLEICHLSIALLMLMLLPTNFPCLQTASARLQDLQKEAKGLASKVEAMQKTHKTELLKRKQEKEALEQQLAQQLTHGARATELQKVVEALQATDAQHKAEAAESSKVQAAHQAQIELLEGRLADATGWCHSQQAGMLCCSVA